MLWIWFWIFLNGDQVCAWHRRRLVSRTSWNYPKVPLKALVTHNSQNKLFQSISTSIEPLYEVVYVRQTRWKLWSSNYTKTVILLLPFSDFLAPSYPHKNRAVFLPRSPRSILWWPTHSLFQVQTSGWIESLGFWPWFLNWTNGFDLYVFPERVKATNPSCFNYSSQHYVHFCGARG